MKLTEAQLKAVKYYEGDVSGNDPFWSDPKAYVTLNSLFFEGIQSETKRANEGKKLNPAIVEDPMRLLTVLKELLSSFEVADLSKERHTFRVERTSDFEQMVKYGCTQSFTSTSTNEFLKAYGDRVGITLMLFHLPPFMPCLPYEELLKEDYLKTEEHECLLPPFLALSFKKAELTSSDLEITDANNNPPVAKYDVYVLGQMERECKGSLDILMGEGKDAAKRVYEALNKHERPDEKDVDLYLAWKQNLKDLL